MTQRVDLSALATAMDEAADEIGKAALKLNSNWTVDAAPRMLQALSSLWRLEGHLTGMADALRMVEVNDE